MTHPLTQYRTAHGLTLQQLGEGVGVHKSTVLDWERGGLPRPDALGRIERFTKGEVSAAAMVAAAMLARQQQKPAA